MSLVGTNNNCAGGPTPWRTWITCDKDTLTSGDNFAEDHGYNFEVTARSITGLTKIIPLKAMGRFNHEAVAVDSWTEIVYQTEDRMDGLGTIFPADAICNSGSRHFSKAGNPWATSAIDNWWQPDSRWHWESVVDPIGPDELLVGQHLVDRAVGIANCWSIISALAFFCSMVDSGFSYPSVSHGTSYYFNPFFFPNRF